MNILNYQFKWKFFGLIGLPLQLTVIYKNKKISVKSDQCIEKAQNVPLTNERIKEQLSKLGNTTFYLENVQYVFKWWNYFH